MSDQFRITVEDLQTGDKGTKTVGLHDYFLLTTGDCTSSVQAYANGTHVITVKGRK